MVRTPVSFFLLAKIRRFNRTRLTRGIFFTRNRCIITLQDPLNLTLEAHPTYLHASFAALLRLASSVHAVAFPLRTSPYPLNLKPYHGATSLTHILGLLLPAAIESQRYHSVRPRLYILYRLTVLFYIHVLVLEYALQSPETLAEELNLLMQHLYEIQSVERYVTIETLPMMVLKAGGEDAVERRWAVLRLVNVVKLFGAETMVKMMNMFMGYLAGKRYADPRERVLLWDVDALKEEFREVS